MGTNLGDVSGLGGTHELPSAGSATNRAKVDPAVAITTTVSTAPRIATPILARVVDTNAGHLVFISTSELQARIVATEGSFLRCDK